MIVMQFTDNFGNMVFGRYNDFYDVAEKRYCVEYCCTIQITSCKHSH